MAQSYTDKPVKGMLTGPVTIINWSFPRQDVSRSTTSYQLAFALREEVADLEKAGCSIIQVPPAPCQPISSFFRHLHVESLRSITGRNLLCPHRGPRWA